MRRFLLPVLFLTTRVLFAQIPEASFPPLVRVPPVEKPPVIDGVISPGEWEKAFLGTGIAPYRKGGLDPILVQYWFAYDEKNIYIAARMQTHPQEVFDKPPRRLAGGGPTSHFEILIDPHPCHPDFNWVQAMMYPFQRYKNVGYSQRIGGYIPYDVKWNYQDFYADGFWSIEMSAPVSSFPKARIKEGESWGVLYAGSIPGAPGVYYFSGQLGDIFRERARYLKMVFDSKSPVVQVKSMGEVLSGKVSPFISVWNTTAKDLNLQAEFVIRDRLTGWTTEERKEIKKLSLPVGEKGSFSWETPTPQPGKTEYLFITIFDRSGRSFYEGIYKIEAPRTPIWGEKKPLPEEPVLFESWFYPYFHRVKAVVDFGGLENPDKVSLIRFKVSTATGQELVQAETNKFDNQAAEAIIQLPDSLPEGNYEVTAWLFDKNNQLLTRVKDFIEKKKFPFEHNQLGISSKVLYPWTPVKINQKVKTVAVWNRVYHLDKSCLPARIETAGSQILSSPIVLVEKSGGKRFPLKGESLSFTQVTDSQVKVSGKASGKKVKAEINLLAEYDGMLKYEVVITGEKDSLIEGLDLIIPFREENAQFIHAAGDGCRSNISRKLPGNQGKIFSSTEVLNWTMPASWIGYLWLGDYERGLCWWADSAEGWSLPEDKSIPVINVYRRPGQVEVVLHLIDKPRPVLWKNKEPRKIVFALEATPIKPRPSWARDIGLVSASLTKQNFPRFYWVGNTYWTFFGQEKENEPASGRYTFAHLRPLNQQAAEELKKRTSAQKAHGCNTLVYTDMRSRSLSHEEPGYYAWEWSPTTDDVRKREITGAPYYASRRISATRSRIDYDLWCFNLGMELGIDYWYFDEIQNEGQINPVTDCGYQDETGRWLPTGRLFAYRELWKRLYTLMQEKGQKEPVIVIHNTSTTYAGPMAFTTATWDFEEANTDPASRHLTMFGIGYLIAETMGHQYGFVGSTLGPLGPAPGYNFEPWLKNCPEEVESAARHWLGVHLILDMNPYLSSHKIVAQGLKMLGEFGWNQPDCQWVPFWKAEKEKFYKIKPDSREKIYCSLYQRPGKTLVIILNDTGKDVVVDWSGLRKLKVKKVVDAEAPDRKILPAGGTYRIPVSHFNYRALLVETEERKFP